MRSSVTYDHHHRTVGKHLLGHAEKADAIVGDQIGEIVLLKKKKKKSTRVQFCKCHKTKTRI